MPEAWLKETEDVVTIDFRGTGPGSVLSLSSKGSYKSQKRPGSQLSFDTDTNEEPGDQEKHHQFGNAVPTRKKTSKCSKLSLPDNESGTCTLNTAKKHVWFSQRANSQMSEECANVDTPKNFEGKCNSLKYRINGKKPDPRKYEIAPVTNVSWQCPICFMDFQGTATSVSCQKRKHVATRHPEVPYKLVIQRPKILAATATEALPTEQRAWQCPYCPAGLPMLATRRDRHVAVESRRKTCHPEVDTKTWKRDQTRVWAKGVKKPKESAMQLNIHDARRQQKWPSHDLVAIYNTSEKAAKSRHGKEFWCRNCLGKLAGYGGNNVIRDKQLSCQQAQSLPGTRNRVRRAWKCLQHKVQANGRPRSVQQCSQWIRNHLCDGDIEANPGQTPVPLPPDLALFP